jgi:[protein-PII] uridylyltransferase
MPADAAFHPDLLAAKQRLLAGSAALRAQYARGTPAVAIATRRTALVDSVVLELFETALRDMHQDGPSGLRQQIAIVPYGGYGRRTLAPFSDVDLMILHAPRLGSKLTKLAARLMRDLFDTGLDLGHSVRTPAEACRLARRDASIYSSLTDTRLLAGSEQIFRQFQTRCKRLRVRHQASLIEGLLAARDAEQTQFGETVYLLEPNVKRSPGGLRDLHLLRWLGYTRFGTPDPERLRLLGALSSRDLRSIHEAHQFLTRIRHDMHFHSGKADDVLVRPEQVRLAKQLGFSGTDTLLPVEQFMREHFRQTSQVRYLASRFADSVRPASTVRQVLAPMFSHQMEGDYRVGPREISATRQGLQRLKRDLGEVLRLSDLANAFDKRIAPATWATVYRSTPHYGEEISAPVAARFLSLLARPTRLAELLRSLHQLHVLEKIVPPFAHARCLLQFNQYHKYTVDEHCIRAVQFATTLVSDAGPMGHAYRQIKDKRTLHLALLLHDLGKGLPGDHSETGRKIAQEMTARLRLPPREAEIVVQLVHQHLRMSHLAFRRDTSDTAIIVRFAVAVGSPKVLRMLYVLSCADLAAVGPDVLNSWKVEVLTDLYRRTMRQLGAPDKERSDEYLQQRRAELRACFEADELDPWLTAQLDLLSTNYLLGQMPERSAVALRRLRSLPANGTDAWGGYLAESHTVEFLVGATASLSDGLFHRLAGALTSRGAKILSAQIDTLANGLVLDRFVVEDPDFAGPPSATRIDAICQTLVDAAHRSGPPKFRHVWGAENLAKQQELSAQQSQVRIDNSTSDRYTIIEIFTFDSTGLLYRIARQIFALNLSIAVAKIGTYLDQVVDVFYVTDAEGRPIKDEHRLETIRQQLLEVIAHGKAE